MRIAVARRTLATFLLLGGCVASATKPTTVILLRHAERESLSTPDPELSDAGRVRALALATAMRDAGVQAIITTQFIRTRATAEPLALALGLMPEIIPDTGVGHARDVADAILRKHAGQTVLVVGHGHTVPAIMRALGVTAPIAVLCENQYDLIFFISVTPSNPTRVVRARYGVASPPDSTCTRKSLCNGRDCRRFIVGCHRPTDSSTGRSSLIPLRAVVGSGDSCSPRWLMVLDQGTKGGRCLLLLWPENGSA